MSNRRLLLLTERLLSFFILTMSDLSTYNKILDVASSLFASKGYAAVSMRDIAMAVQVTPANLYYHFKDKEHLIRETLTYVFFERMAPTQSLLAQRVSAVERLEMFITWFTRLIFEDEIFTRLLCRELLNGDSDRLEYLAQTVFEEPFSLLAGVTVFDSARTDPVMSAVSVVSVILGHYQLSGVLPHLPGGQAADPDRVSLHLLSLLRPVLKESLPPSKDC
jgi:AcrR family transcriptional regulator